MGIQVRIDVAVRDGRVILIEISSYVRAYDVILFKRKAEFYAKKTGRKPDRKLMVAPSVEKRALMTASK